MAKHEKKIFESADEVFKLYIPDYIPTNLRKAREEGKDEINLSPEFTDNLLKRFKHDISLRRSK